MSNVLKKFRCTDEILNGAHIALDVDGTLTRGLCHDVEGNFGDVVAMLKYLYSKNVAEVFMATGRPPWSAIEWIDNTFEGSSEYDVKNRFMEVNHVLFDGAAICNLKEVSIFQKSISKKAIKKIEDILEGKDVKYGFDTFKEYFISKGYDEDYFPAEEYPSLSDLEEQVVYAGYMIDLGTKDRAKVIMDHIDMEVDGVKCHYFYSFKGRHCAVINPEGVNKMIGIQTKFQEESGDFEKLIFFGDGENDLPVFEEALSDDRIIAIPSPYTKDASPILNVSKWSRPLGSSVGETLGLNVNF